MKKYIFLAASALALASCSSDDFLGDTPGSTPTSANSAINFGGDAGKITRATSNEGNTQQMLDGQFLVYGVKKTNDEIFHNVFVNYSVWDVEANNTTSNTNGWEYVGTKDAANLGIGKITLKYDQTIKYWDYSASVYHFVAGSPIDAFKYTISPDLTTGTDIESATVTGLAGHIEANNTETALKTNPVYIAAPVKIAKDDYQKPVKFTFIRQQSMVRVGIYETIPGYSITDIKFYAYDTDDNTLKVSKGNNVILTSATDGYFVGGSNLTGTVTYDWKSTTPSYTYKYDDTNLVKSKNWYAGKLSILATTSSEPTVATLYGTDKDMSTTGYFTVLPTPSETKASPILIKCDYTLTDFNSGETIKVTGATAAIPAAYSKWEPNTRYTYLFKISDKTNGTTGDPNNPDDPAGLYPITFNAVVTEMADKTQGTTTTVATPSITTYQEGSVVDNTIKYVANKKIDVTVTESTSGTKQNLSTTGSAVGHIAVYKFTAPITEAEVQVKGTTGVGVTEVTNGSVADNVYTFTPEGEGYYAIQYLTTAAVGNKPAAYTYKVVYVAAATK
uniref:hypothetical protein n=1 Tax=Prevotella sp. TaxID=59823 RepID=UPI003FEE8B7F